MRKPRTILIFKAGFSEFLDRGISTTVSLGDVLFCTALLPLYKGDNVTWVTAWPARELLQGNPLIRELLIFGPKTFEDLRSREFDVLINLEKDIGICCTVAQIKARKRFGFYYNERAHDISTFKRSTKYLLAGQENHRTIDSNFFEILYQTVGKSWRGQGPVLKKPPAKKEKYDIGFNHAVGSKWPTKAWPHESWKELEKLLGSDYKISWQQGFSNLKKYIRWLSSCRVIVTSDSLGQVLGQALGKKVVSLYGPTDYRRVRGIPNIFPVAAPSDCPHLPCYLLTCKYEKFCMNEINPVEVERVVRKVLEK